MRYQLLQALQRGPEEAMPLSLSAEIQLHTPEDTAPVPAATGPSVTDFMPRQGNPAASLCTREKEHFLRWPSRRPVAGANTLVCMGEFL